MKNQKEEKIMMCDSGAKQNKQGEKICYVFFLVLNKITSMMIMMMMMKHVHNNNNKQTNKNIPYILSLEKAKKKIRH